MATLEEIRRARALDAIKSARAQDGAVPSPPPPSQTAPQPVAMSQSPATPVAGGRGEAQPTPFETIDQLEREGLHARNEGRFDDEARLFAMADQARADAGLHNSMLPAGNDIPPTPRAPDRFGDTVAAAQAAPRAAMDAAVDGLTGAGPSPTANALPERLPDFLRTPVGAVGDAGLAGLSALGLGYATAAGGLAELMGGSPTNEMKLARDLMMMGEVAAPELTGVSTFSRAATQSARNAQRIAEPANDLQRQARAADDLGITPSLGARGRSGAFAAGQLEKVPLAGTKIVDDAARMVGEIEGVFHQSVGRLGSETDAVSAGNALQDGVRRYAERFRERSGELYAQVDQFMPPDTRISAPETVAKIQEALAPFADNPQIRAQLGLDKWQTLSDGLESGLSWEAARALRTNIGESIGKINGPLADMDQGRLKGVYAALTNDLDGAVQQSGSSEAISAWNRANDYYRNGARRVQEQLDKTISADTPERAFEAFAAMTREGSRADAQRLQSIKASVGRDEWREISATIVGRLGRATNGAQNAAGDAFSASRFLTNYNAMTDDAKRILLPPEVRTEMQKLAEVAEAAKGANAERNFSNTGNVLAGSAITAGLVSSPISTSLAVGGLALSSQAMTNVTFLRALNKATRGDASAIRAMSRGSGPFNQDAAEIIQLLGANMSDGTLERSTIPQEEPAPLPVPESPDRPYVEAAMR